MLGERSVAISEKDRDASTRGKLVVARWGWPLVDNGQIGNAIVIEVRSGKVYRCSSFHDGQIPENKIRRWLDYGEGNRV